MPLDRWLEHVLYFIIMQTVCTGHLVIFSMLAQFPTTSHAETHGRKSWPHLLTQCLSCVAKRGVSLYAMCPPRACESGAKEKSIASCEGRTKKTSLRTTLLCFGLPNWTFQAKVFADWPCFHQPSLDCLWQTNSKARPHFPVTLPLALPVTLHRWPPARCAAPKGATAPQCRPKPTGRRDAGF